MCWCEAHFWTCGALLSIALGVGSLWAMAALVVRVPADYFLQPPGALRWRGWLHAGEVVVRNVIGVVLIVVGVLMALPGVPGQGLLTLLTGLLLTDLPGKRRLELWLLRLPRRLRHLRLSPRPHRLRRLRLLRPAARSPSWCRTSATSTKLPSSKCW